MTDIAEEQNSSQQKEFTNSNACKSHIRRHKAYMYINSQARERVHDSMFFDKAMLMRPKEGEKAPAKKSDAQKIVV